MCFIGMPSPYTERFLHNRFFHIGLHPNLVNQVMEVIKRACLSVVHPSDKSKKNKRKLQITVKNAENTQELYNTPEKKTWFLQNICSI